MAKKSFNDQLLELLGGRMSNISAQVAEMEGQKDKARKETEAQLVQLAKDPGSIPYEDRYRIFANAKTYGINPDAAIKAVQARSEDNWKSGAASLADGYFAGGLIPDKWIAKLPGMESHGNKNTERARNFGSSAGNLLALGLDDFIKLPGLIGRISGNSGGSKSLKALGELSTWGSTPNSSAKIARKTKQLISKADEIKATQEYLSLKNAAANLGDARKANPKAIIDPAVKAAVLQTVPGQQAIALAKALRMLDNESVSFGTAAKGAAKALRGTSAVNIGKQIGRGVQVGRSVPNAGLGGPERDAPYTPKAIQKTWEDYQMEKAMNGDLFKNQ